MRILALLFLVVLIPAPASAAPDDNYKTVYEGHVYDTDTRIIEILADQGNPAAENRVGEFYRYAAFTKQKYKGVGGEQGYEEAVKFFRKAGQAGNPKAQYNLAMMYENGWGVARDYKESAAWYQKAAAQNQILAQANLAVQYENGRGVKQDYVEAYVWYSLSTKVRTDKYIANHLKLLVATKMTKAEKAVADKRVKQWRPIPAQPPDLPAVAKR